MDKKKIIFLLLSLFMLSNIHTYSQELQWQEKNELTKFLYQSMKNFTNETAFIKIKLPSIFEVALFDYLNVALTRKKKEKKYTEQKLMRQQEVKNFIETHFIFYDTVPELIFFDKNQILEWGKSFGFVQTEEFNLKNNNIFILMVDVCSGVRCLNIYVFKQEDKNWKLLTGTNTNIREKVIIRINNEQNKIIFETISGEIGKIPFKKLLDLE